MLSEILKPIVDYLGKQPFQNVLTAALLSVIVWSIYDRHEQSKEAHNTFHQVLKERDERDDRNIDRMERQNERVIAALTGVKQEVKKNTAATQEIPVAAAAAAAKIVEGVAADKSSE